MKKNCDKQPEKIQITNAPLQNQGQDKTSQAKQMSEDKAQKE